MFSYSLWSRFTQMFPPKPTFTENDVPDLTGKVYLVSGGSSGLGKELVRILYLRNAKVWIAARSEEKTKLAMEEIKEAVSQSNGSMVFLKVDFMDLSSVKAAATEFLAAETKLNVLFNNAAIMSLDSTKSHRTAQGHEINLGVNSLATFLFTKLLTPLLISMTRSEPQDSIRVVWVSSSGTEYFGTKDIGMPMDNLDYHNDTPAMLRYSLSKVAIWAYSTEYAKRHRADGIISVSLNPGNLSSDLFRENGFAFLLMLKLIQYPVVNGACTELFAGLSPMVGMEQTGAWIIPFGRIYPIRADLEPATKTDAEGGTGGNAKFYDWTEEQIKAYL